MTAILNRRVLLAAGVIVAMTALTLGATYAAWTASDEIENNTVSTAVLSITAAGVPGSGGAQPLPFSETNLLPGFVSTPEERATITNGSPVELDLYMYVSDVVGPACDATKLAWQSSTAGGGPVWFGYTPGNEPELVGTIAGAGDTNFALLSTLEGEGSKVLISDSANFEPGEVIAMRQIVGFADDADQSLHAGGCTWTLNFVGETI